MKHFIMVFATVSALVSAACAKDQLRPDDLDFFLGEWNITSSDYMPGGSYAISRATSKAYAILDGAAIFDEWRSLDEDGNVVFRGASYRTYLPRQNKWRILWMMAHVDGETVIDAKKVGDEIEMQGEGEDPYGKFLERARYYDISENGFKFTMDRSYDGGETWITPFNEFEAVRKD